MKQIGFIVVVLLIVLTGCTKAEEATPLDDKPKYQEDPSVLIDKDEVILFTYTDMAKGLGDLYLQKGETDKEKIASNVLEKQFGYLYNAKAAFYIDTEHKLYMKESGQPSEQISTDVYADSLSVSKDETTILFLKSVTAKDYTAEHGDLYRMVKGGEKEKLASEVKLSDYQLSDNGDVATFVTNDGSLYRKAEDATEKEKIGSAVINHRTSPDGSATIYQNEDSDVYLKKISSIDKEKLSSELAGAVQFTNDSQSVAYLDEYRAESTKGELMLLKEGYEKAKLASDITEYQFTALGDYIFFLNEDKTLYAKELSDEQDETKGSNKKDEPAETPEPLKSINPAEKIKIADDIISFSVAPDGSSVIFTDADHNVFIQRNGEEKAKVASDIKEARLYNQTILMLDNEKSLFSLDLALEPVSEKEEDADKSEKSHKKTENAEVSAPALLPASPIKEKVKLADKVEQYSADPSLKYIVFKTSGKEFFLKAKEQSEPIRVIEKVDAYHSVHFLNKMLYEKLVALDQFVGSWQASSEYEGETFNWYEEFTKDKKHIVYSSTEENSERTFELMNAAVSTVDIIFAKDSDDMFKLEVVDKDTLKAHYYYEGDESITTLKRVTNEELKKKVAAEKATYKKQQEQQAKMDEAYATADRIAYTYVYNANEGVKVYDEPSTKNLAGTLGTYVELYVTETYVTDSGEVWCKSTVYFDDIYSYKDVWYTYKSVS